MFYRATRKLVPKFLRRESGFVLIAGLILLSGLILVGVTAYILASTDIKIGGSYRNSQMALQVAMAGAEQARELLRQTNAASTDTGSFSDELAAAVGANRILEGYAPSATDDVPFIANGFMNGVSYRVYLTNDPQDGETNTTDTNKKITITAVATGPSNGRAQVKTVVSMFPMPSSPATIYTKGDVTLDGGSQLRVNGNDQCGRASAVAPVYTMNDATLAGSPNLSGSPNEPVEHGSLNLDIAGTVQLLSTMASTTLTANQTNVTYGSPSSYQVIYSNMSELRLNNVTGYGILAVQGDLTLAGDFTWNGVILVTGKVTFEGGGGNRNIAGQIISGTSEATEFVVRGSIQLDYNSCYVNNAGAGLPLKVMNWKRVDY